MKKGDFKRGERINFHNLGLEGFNGTDKNGWGMKTLGAIRSMLGHEHVYKQYFITYK